MRSCRPLFNIFPKTAMILNLVSILSQGPVITQVANTYVLGIIDGTYVGMCEDTGTI